MVSLIRQAEQAELGSDEGFVGKGSGAVQVDLSSLEWRVQLSVDDFHDSVLTFTVAL